MFRPVVIIVVLYGTDVIFVAIKKGRKPVLACTGGGGVKEM